MKKQRRAWGWITSLVILLLAVGYVTWALLRPLPLVPATLTNVRQNIPTGSSQLFWPATGQAAVSLLDSDVMAVHGTQTPAPTASTAKVITALLILQKYSLKLNETGPIVTITSDDVAGYQNYATQEGSTLPVQAGEQLSEYQMLQAMMLPSANNIADTAAIWAYGSLPAYATAANGFLSQHGFNHTHIGSDASGFAPDTTTTAADLVGIGKLAMANPVLTQIVNQPNAPGFPLAGTIKNVNFLLGAANIVGIKTGNSDQAGGVFLGAARTTVNGRQQTIISAVVGAPDLANAMAFSLPLIQSAQSNFTTTQIYKAGQVVATYQAPWGANTTAVSQQAITTTTWRGENVTSTLNLKPIRPESSSQVGTVAVRSTTGTDQQAITLAHPLAPPSWKWRLMHPLPIK